MSFPEFKIQLPDWVEKVCDQTGIYHPGIEDQMRLVVELSRRNIEHNTGGPFAAAIFDREGMLIAPGVNLVMFAGCSVLHAEIVAIILAQKDLGRFDLGDNGTVAYDLVSTTEPCAMCLGAIPWSGVSRLICGAREEDARKIGFDEGAKPNDWMGELERRGMIVLRDVLREEAVKVLEEYQAGGGVIYNPHLDAGCSGHDTCQ